MAYTQAEWNKLVYEHLVLDLDDDEVGFGIWLLPGFDHNRLLITQVIEEDEPWTDDPDDVYSINYVVVLVDHGLKDIFEIESACYRWSDNDLFSQWLYNNGLPDPEGYIDQEAFKRDTGVDLLDALDMFDYSLLERH